MKITKRKLLEKMRFTCSGTGCVHTSNHGLTWDWERLVCDLAVALGHEVVEGPELPERLELVGFGDNLKLYRRIDDISGWRLSIGDEPQLVKEIICRYNAQAKVLEVAKELERFMVFPAPSLLTFTARLRAAYEEAEGDAERRHAPAPSG